jgi:hypothetical protein
MQFLIKKYSLNYTCWTLIAWKGISTVHADNTTSKRNIAEGKVHLIVESIYWRDSV